MASPARDELAETVEGAAGSREHGFAREIPAQIGGEFGGALIAPGGLLFERLQDDVIEVGVNARLGDVCDFDQAKLFVVS